MCLPRGYDGAESALVITRDERASEAEMLAALVEAHCQSLGCHAAVHVSHVEVKQSMLAAQQEQQEQDQQEQERASTPEGDIGAGGCGKDSRRAQDSHVVEVMLETCSTNCGENASCALQLMLQEPPQCGGSALPARILLLQVVGAQT